MKLIEFDQQFSGSVIGIDEAGRGPLAGPLVLAAVMLQNIQTLPLFINDSKKLSKKQREKLFSYLVENSYYNISIIDPSTIDKINILEATKLGMNNLIHSFQGKFDHILVDGNQLPPITSLAKYHAIIKGDSLSASIAAASIIAKVTRDRLMTQLSTFYPNYGWEQNAGYGTKQHLNAIDKFGITIHHRKSYAPIKNKLENAKDISFTYC